MRGKRKLAAHVWYFVATAVNDTEPLFWSGCVVWLLARVLSEAKEIFAFELRGLRFDGARVSFYIRPANGFELPEIVKWVKQTFAVRFNLLDGRTGHIWGDRYWSEILAGEPPEWAEVCDSMSAMGKSAWRPIRWLPRAASSMRAASTRRKPAQPPARANPMPHKLIPSSEGSPMWRKSPQPAGNVLDILQQKRI